MRILVTGASGSVGRGLIPALLSAGHQVVGLDKDAGVGGVIAHPRLGVVQGALEDPETGRRVVADTGRADVRRALAIEDGARVHGVLRRTRVDALELSTAEPYELALAGFFKTRERRR